MPLLGQIEHATKQSFLWNVLGGIVVVGLELGAYTSLRVFEAEGRLSESGLADAQGTFLVKRKFPMDKIMGSC